MTVKLNHEYHVVELYNYQIPDEVVEWLADNCGSGHSARWFYKHPKIYFEEPHDHLMFTLRWS